MLKGLFALVLAGAMTATTPTARLKCMMILSLMQ